MYYLLCSCGCSACGVLWGGGRVILHIACVAIYALWSGGRMIICILVWLLCVWRVMEW